MARLLLALLGLAAAYRVEVMDRNPTGKPLLSYAENTSFAKNILNAAWLPLDGNEGGGLFFRVLDPPGEAYDVIGWVEATDADGLDFGRAGAADLLPGDGGKALAGADPRCYSDGSTAYLIVQAGTDAYPGRHSFLRSTATPRDPASWAPVAGDRPMFANLTTASGGPFLEAASLVACDAGDRYAPRWSAAGDAVALESVARPGRCLARTWSPDASHPVGLADCAAAPRWRYNASTAQLAAGRQCLDADRGTGPKVGLWACHAPSDKDFAHQRWNVAAGVLRSRAADLCVATAPTTPDDCGTAIFFPDGPGGAKLAVATFGELRGGNLSLVSSDDLEAWTYERELLATRPGHWDNATLSAGPPPQRLSDGNWLLLYNVDQLWPVDDPAPLPWFGRCALGWAILRAGDYAVLARADAPLAHAELPWEKAGFTADVVYTDGVRPRGVDAFTVYAGAGDSVVEAFTIQVTTA